jgi:vacuolar-type H+-ATPase subunit E/Vma4
MNINIEAGEDLENIKINRVGHLQKMLDDEKRELLKKVARHNQAIVSSSNPSLKQKSIEVIELFYSRE